MRSHHVALALLALGGSLASALPAQDTAPTIEADVVYVLSTDDGEDATALKGKPRVRMLRLPEGRFTDTRLPDATPVGFDDDEKPRLGVTVDISDDGLVVTKISEGSLAERAKLSPGDVLHRVNGVVVTSVEDVAKGLGASDDGVNTISVIREGEGLVTIDVEPARQRRAAPEGRLRLERLPEGRTPRRLELLPEGGTVRRFEAAPGGGGFLGVNLGGGSDRGVQVAGIIPSSAAWFAGLAEGDMLVAIDGERLSTPDDVVGAISGKAAGTFIKVTYVRDGEKNSVKARLSTRLPTGALGMLSPGANELRFGTPQFSGLPVDPGSLDLEALGGMSFGFAPDMEGMEFDSGIALGLDLSELHEHLGQIEHLDLSELHEHLGRIEELDLSELHEHLGQIEELDLSELHEHLGQLHELGDMEELHEHLQQLQGQAGNMFFLNDDDHGGQKPRIRMQRRHGADGHDVDGMLGKLMQEYGIDDGEHGSMKITISDGVMTIERDGETETVELHDDEDLFDSDSF